MAMNTAMFGNLLEPILKNAFFEKYLSIPSFISKVFNEIKSEKYQETHLGIYGGQGFTPFTGTVAREEFGEEYKKVITNVSYSDSFGVTYDMFKDDQFGIMKQRAAALGRLARYSKEVLAASIFNNGFSSAVQSGDAQNLFSASHPLLRGGTWSNILSPAADLSATSLQTAIDNFTTTKDDSGKYQIIKPKYIFVHPNA